MYIFLNSSTQEKYDHKHSWITKHCIWLKSSVTTTIWKFIDLSQKNLILNPFLIKKEDGLVVIKKYTLYWKLYWWSKESKCFRFNDVIKYCDRNISSFWFFTVKVQRMVKKKVLNRNHINSLTLRIIYSSITAICFRTVQVMNITVVCHKKIECIK